MYREEISKITTTNLEMWTRDALGNLSKERLLDPRKLGRLNDVEYLFDFAQKHHLLLAARFRPIFEQSPYDGFR